MFKKCIFIFSIYLSAIVYADNSVGNIVSSVAPSSNNSGAQSSAKMLDVEYSIHNYQMKPLEFAKFLETNNLSPTVNPASSTNIVSLTILQKEEFDTLSQKLDKDFSNKVSGNNRCVINNDLCAGGTGTSSIPDPKTGKLAIASKMSISFKVFDHNKELSAKVISDNYVDKQATTLNLIPLKSEAMLSDIKNKNYVLISQISKNDILYGQIIQVSFNSK